MPRSTTVVAFCATVGLAVPAGWHLLGASIQSEARKLRPADEKVTINGAEVRLAIDKGIVLTGDAVTATLVATAPESKQVAVDLWVMQSHNYEGARVETPDVAIDHEKLVLQAAPGGGKPVKTRLVLGEKVDRLAQIDNFKVLVLPHGVSPRDENELAEGSSYGASEGKAAMTHVIGWSGNSFDIDIDPVGKVTGDPFVVAVRIKNTTDRKLPEPYINLGTTVAQYGLSTDDAFAVTDIEDEKSHDNDYDDDGNRRHSWKPGQVRVQKFLVTPAETHPDQVTFVARATVAEYEPGPVIAGAMDAQTFKVKAAPKHEKPADAAEPTVAVK